MSKGQLIIKPHQVMTCPRCNTHGEFQEHVYYIDLPVLLKCGNCDYKYRLDDITKHNFHLPKRDTRLPVAVNWELIRSTNGDFPVQGEAPAGASDDGHAELLKQLETIPPEFRTRGVHERIDELSSMMIVMKRVEYSIVRDFRTACEAFIDDINTGISPYAHLRGYVDADALVEFFERPFLIMPMDFASAEIQKLSRLVASPRFYQKIHGLPVGNGHGFNMQLVCPYAELGEAHPPFLRKMLGLPEPPNMEVLDRKVVGAHIPYHWKDIPGLEPDIDHSDNHPSVRMAGDGSKFRQWAAQWGVKPWRPLLNRHDAFFEGRLDWLKVHQPTLHPVMQLLVHQGRVLYAHRDRAKRLRMIGAAVQCLQSHAIVVHGNGEQISWADMGVLFGTEVLRNLIVPMNVSDFLRGDYCDQTELIIVEADKDYSADLLPRLYNHHNRLLIVTGDPLFDALEFNTYAPVVYGLINATDFSPESFLAPRMWHKDSPRLNEKLIIALRDAGFLSGGV